jgi:hypothetical protein
MGKILAFLRGKSEAFDVVHKSETNDPETQTAKVTTATFKIKKGEQGTSGLQVLRLASSSSN